MIPRYEDERIAELWSLEKKYQSWQKVELAVIQAREALGRIPPGTHQEIEQALEANSIDEKYIEETESILQHDLNAFLEERIRFLPSKLGVYFHESMTSYDTEEAPFSLALRDSCDVVFSDTQVTLEHIKKLAIMYRYAPMNARTHGQEAELQSFGKRCLTWYTDLQEARQALHRLMRNLTFSKLSGAIGTNSGIDPELETAALKILGLEPRIGVTQIMPRIMYAPIANALACLVLVIQKIMDDVRLGARSGRTIYREPFAKKQKGSSAMPHKKNTIRCENTVGMARLACGHASSLTQNILTWEERDIGQSSVERVAWPDLFHETINALKNLSKVMRGLVVYPDAMLIEIIELRGCYASNEAKEFLTKIGASHGLTREEAYRVVQLASFNAFDVPLWQKVLRKPADSLENADDALEIMSDNGGDEFRGMTNIQDIIKEGTLWPCEELGITEDQVELFNEKLRQIFDSSQEENWSQWKVIFQPSHILANEAHLFKEVFGV